MVIRSKYSENATFCVAKKMYALTINIQIGCQVTINPYVPFTNQSDCHSNDILRNK